ncbi:uncharacterized protein LACBIDRAFT_332611 [Laccaria bicolor S238N-H82]|uniref:Predicted protein n=1 Tax=Laccaria bicolor (strain S238N-H82 / ATCC MYA-4686) TaxID=486041 RepID=B0DTC4_LACBS|nr:uncharacterized protein LACBIDRAFT_332611 [Laccaria bicolor S238N-H82]EDR02250.1 predicted protein [Laccaria bicolor S238N-H82]|eukprot:XP_001887195.1 predicted protein [Laccaria bicolor S238N-H82]
MEDIESIGPGEICSVFGVECSSGDTFTDGSTSFSMTNMYVSKLVISLSIKPKSLETPNFSRALNRFQKEDPTLKVHIDHKGKEVRLLHVPPSYQRPANDRLLSRPLLPAWENFNQKYMWNACANTDCVSGKPRVASRETITQRADFAYTHKKQSGGVGSIRQSCWGFYEAFEKGDLCGNAIFGRHLSRMMPFTSSIRLNRLSELQPSVLYVRHSRWRKVLFWSQS